MKLDELFDDIEDEHSMIENQIEKQRRLREKENLGKGADFIQNLVATKPAN